MKTFHRRAAVVCGLVLLCLCGLTAPVRGAAENYWPFQVGNTWTLDTKANNTTVSMVLTVTKVTAGEGNASDAYIEYQTDGKVMQTEIYRFDDQGISRVADGKDAANTLSPPFPIAQYPLTDGRKWTWTGTITTAAGQTFKGTSDLSVSGPETVQTAAGDFKAMRVHSELAILLPGGQKAMFPNDYWFSPGVGMVQQSAKIGETTYVGVMSSYKLQK
ncbi:MAG TPA: hypothetical protein VK717_03505 [Opitutaceae bacterium]|jgi:hypothetical protein|nr:hypothetical protein [Opitutaceae bacterium]